MYKLITGFFIVIFLIITLVFVKESYAQTDYIMRVANGEMVNDNTIEFDVYIKSLNSDFILTSYQCVLSFTQSIINNGVLTFSYIPGTSEFINMPPLIAIGLLNNNNVYVLTFASLPPGEEIITNTEKKVGRFRLLNTNSYSGSSFNIWWKFSNNASTILTGAGFTDITNVLSHVNLSGNTTFQLTVSIHNDWNLVSVPGVHPLNQNVNTWWINKDPGAHVFKYNGGYQAVTTVEPGRGYWMKHLGDQVYNTGDEWPAEGFFYADYNPIPANSGWNVFGVYDYEVPVSDITTTPQGLLTGYVFRFYSNGGYQVVNNLQPGYGYWIKLTDAGLINLPQTVYNPLETVMHFTENLGRIIITDYEGKICTLYIINEVNDLDRYQLPPVPNFGMFDIRFTSDRFVENINTGYKSIIMSGVKYPVNVKVENTSLILRDETGNNINISLRSGEEISVNDNLITKLFVSSDRLFNKLSTGGIIPDQYALEQNFPNPFNPATVIGFSVPEDANDVKLTVYNALGQVVAELVNSKLEAGKYSYQWDAGSLASGIYIYELRTNKFVSIKKMMIIK